MSIQLEISSPYNFLKDHKKAKNFVSAVCNATGGLLEASNTFEETIDLPISACNQIDDLYYGEYGDCIERDIFLTGLILPFKFDGLIDIKIKGEKIINIVSYELYEQTLCKYEKFIMNKITDEELLEQYTDFFACYRDAIDLCVKNKAIVYMVT